MAWPVVGHEWAIELLAQAIREARVSHAYLFIGPSQVGKTTVARTFAQALVCQAQDGSPCGVCGPCRRLAENRYPDVQFIAAEKNSLQIEQIRRLQIDAAIAPLEGKRKVFIISEFERATLPAANALLKTLEEPPGHVVILLTARGRDQLLPTVLSRCQVFNLRALPVAQTQTALQTRWAIDESQAELLARLSQGRPGWAVTAHTMPELWRKRAKYLDDLITLAAAGHVPRLGYAETLSRAGEDIELALGLWVSWWRDVLLVQHDAWPAVQNLDHRTQLLQQASLFQPRQIEQILQELLQTVARIKANVNVRLALDVLLLKLPKPSIP